MDGSTGTLSLDGTQFDDYSINADLPVSTGTLMDFDAATLAVYNLRQQYNSYFEPGNTYGGNWFRSNNFPLQIRDARTSVGGLPLEPDSVPTDGLAGGADHLGAWWYRPLDTEYSQYSESANVYGAITARTGDITATMGAVWSGAPSGGGLSYGLAGSFSGLYALIQEDIHAEGNVYAREYGIIGMARQAYGKLGSFIVSTNGSGIAPYAGFARLSVWNDAQGTRYRNTDSSAPYRGSIADWHLFDETIATSGSLITSTTLSLAGSSYEGQATILSGNSSVTVSTALVSTGDVALLTYPGSANSGGALWADTITASTSFVVRSTAAVTTDTAVNWKLIK